VSVGEFSDSIDANAAPAAIAAVTPSASGGRIASHLAGRTPEFIRQLSVHEIGHALTSRSLGTTVVRTTIVPSGAFAGRCFRVGAGVAHFDDKATSATDESLLEICARCPPPSFGESPIAIAEGRARAEVGIIELVAGRVAERAMLGDDITLLDATLDYIEAKALARTLCQPGAVDALIAFAESEARAVIAANCDVIEALVEKLTTLGTLPGDQVDSIIGRVMVERQIAAEARRREQWRRVEQGAAAFEALRQCPLSP
jgi:hypothetical protein